MSKTDVTHKASHLGALRPAAPDSDSVAKALRQISKQWSVLREIPAPRVPDQAPCVRPGVDPDSYSEEAVEAAAAEAPPRERLAAKRDYARRLCFGCPITNDCFAYDVLVMPDQDGVVAGMISKDRRSFKRAWEREQEHSKTIDSEAAGAAPTAIAASRESAAPSATAA